MRYPRPCDTCFRNTEDDNCPRYKKCAEWLTWFRWWWKEFNLYYKKHKED